MILVDTSVIVPCLRRSTRAAFADFLIRISEEEPPAVSVITRFEVIAGTAHEFLKVNSRFLDGFVAIDLDPAIADRAGELSYEWARKGHLLSPNDALIGAAALVHGMTLATTNKRQFPYLTGTETQVIEYRGAKGRHARETVHLCRK